MPLGKTLEDQPQKAEDIVVSLTELWRDAVLRRAPQHAAMLQERRFMYRGDHYADESQLQHNQHRLKPRGRQTWSKHRHKLGQITKPPIYIDVEPAEPGATPEEGEDVVAIMNREIHDPARLYKRIERRAISSALASRMGAIGLDVDYSVPGFPRVMPFLADPTRLFWTPGWTDLDDVTCPWVAYEKTMLCSHIRDMASDSVAEDFRWQNVNEVRPDDGDRITGDTRSSNSDGNRNLLDNASGSDPGEWKRKDKATVVMFWFRKDETKKTETTKRTRSLPPSQQYMACPACGYRDYTPPEEMQGLDGQPLKTLPEHGGPCPECLKQNLPVMMGRVKKEWITEDMLAYPKGRLVIFAPVSKVKLYDGPWPWQLRNVPFMVIPCYEDPYEQIGLSDTSWDWDQQLVLNALDRRTYEQIMRSPSIIATNGELTMPDSDEPFEITDEIWSLARWRGLTQPSIQFIQPQLTMSGTAQFRAFISNDLRTDQGISDVGLTGDQLKGVQVGTIERATEMGEVPVDDHVAVIQERRGNLFGVWFDMYRAINEARQWIPIPTESGRYTWKQIRGSELKNYHFVVSGAPDWKRLDKEQLEVVNQLLAIPDDGARELTAMAANLPPSIVRKVQKISQDRKPQTNLKDAAALITACATMVKDAPGSMTEDQIQAVLQMAGIQPSQGGQPVAPTAIQTKLMEHGHAKQMAALQVNQPQPQAA